MATPYPKKGMPEKKKPYQLKRTPIKPKVKKEADTDNSMIKLFVDIWNERKSGSLFVKQEYTSVEEWLQHTSQYRVDCVTYEPIYNMVPANFMHVLTKNHSMWKKEKKNIVMGSFETHQIQEFRPKSELIKHGKGGKWFWLYREMLKEEYESL